MRRRLLIAFVALVLCSLAIAWFGTRLLARMEANEVARVQISGQATAIAAAFDEAVPALAQQARRPDRLDRIRRSLGLRHIGMALVPMDVGVPVRVLAPVPPAVDIGRLRSPGLAAGATLSGVEGGRAWAMAAVNPGWDAPLLVVLVSREVTDPLGPAVDWLLAAGLVAVVVAAIAAIRLSTSLARPVVEATEVALRIAAGDLDTRLPEPPAGSGDEVSDLARAVNGMAESLDRSRGLERQFLLSVSHDLRTPLTSIRGYAEAMVDGTMDDAERVGAVILAESRRLDRLVRDLLSLARLDSRQFALDLRSTDVGSATAGVVDGFSPAALESGISLEVSIPDHRAMALLDVDRWSQVVANLVENGLRYARSRLHVQLTDDVGGMELRVHDDGPGVPADDLPHVFERLYASKHRPDDRESGSGLGLAIVRELVHAMGGSVWAESTPGSGATLLVRIPRTWASASEE